ncbi:hypothetical protein NEILACOT_03472 [Neisseria lactamica ATCC 23970]|uniref:Uncharacterized protein n=1 Tax=Neisseria lactamica ATCC 23970 TaxID=546265 RepID=D0W7H3_NEILA|nr:hypothetical protein NEILACOT_03472 [Neisseria lactamica ATCC 23970]
MYWDCVCAFLIFCIGCSDGEYFEGMPSEVGSGAIIIQNL